MGLGVEVGVTVMARVRGKRIRVEVRVLGFLGWG